MTAPALVVLAKSPQPGRVKTRLTPPLTPGQAADVAAAALHDTLEAVAGCASGRKVVVLDGPPGAWLPEGFEVIAQRGASLAQRLTAAWADVGAPALQLGMDTPQVTAGLLAQCLDVLAQPATDAALGLAADGGWWAIALREGHPLAFADVPMSTPATGRRQVRQLRRLGLRVRALPVLQDVDTIADAWAVAALVPTSRFAEALAGCASSPASDARNVAREEQLR